ncbi:hypothetical protein EDB86DRAFT_3079610 [Lactarius hatsudake]|nr:hypothetical protein EDB86DRAFT_3079610 [Lactarius hatsudake]
MFKLSWTRKTRRRDRLSASSVTAYGDYKRFSPGLAAALAPGRPLRRVTLYIAGTLYDGLRPAALFSALGGALKELGLVLAPDVDVRTRGRLLGVLGNTGAGLEVLELSLDGTSDEKTATFEQRRNRPAKNSDSSYGSGGAQRGVR